MSIGQPYERKETDGKITSAQAEADKKRDQDVYEMGKGPRRELQGHNNYYAV